ncbi:MAG TPA: hypothetical protein VKA15_01375 [Isosphaeraceae bacterium]|nr:hypothetical protein [Isosphaeraceae bacterium]
MTSRVEHRGIGVTVFLALAVSFFAATPAQAQWGMGFGGGFGWGFGFHNVPSPTGYIYQKSLVDAGRGYQGPTRTPYAGNSNAYFNHVRDNGFVERYNVDRRKPSYYRYVPTSARGAPSCAVAAAPEKPRLPLASFYDQQGQLAWPTDSPTNGDLKDKRSTFDQASLVVLDESKKSGVASMASVTDARQKLIDYGRPALQHVRAHETARLADTFHLFILSLYESLAQAANPTTAAGAPAPPATPSS